MNLSTLISGRTELLRQAHLANLALAYDTLQAFGARIERARLAGRAVLQPGDPAADLPWATLTALEGNQSVIEEHFTDQDIWDLADILRFTLGQNTAEPPEEIIFRLENFAASFVAPVRAELLGAGVKL